MLKTLFNVKNSSFVSSLMLDVPVLFMGFCVKKLTVTIICASKVIYKLVL